MKSYVATRLEDGRDMLAGTQDDARAINKLFNAVEIPTDKAGLMSFAQEALDTAWELRQELNRVKHAQSIQPVTIDVPGASEAATPPPAPTDDRDRRAKETMDRLYAATDIEDFILNRATPAQVGNISSCLGARYRETIKDNAK